MEDTLVTVIVDTNPGTVTLSRDIQNIESVELIYFKIFNHAAPSGTTPVYETGYWIKLDQGNLLPANQTIPSNNIPQVTGSYSRITSDMVLLHTETIPYINFQGANYDYPTQWGYQKKDMRWVARNLHDFDGFRVTLYDLHMNPITLQRAGYQPAYYVLIFRVKFSTPGYLSPDWRTNRLFNNSMSS